MTTRKNLSMFRGDTKNINLTFTDGTTPLDITGSSVWMTVKNSTNDADADAILQKEVTSHTDPTQGETTVTVDPSDTSGKEPGEYSYDIQLVQSGGEVSTVLYGDFTITADITRSS